MIKRKSLKSLFSLYLIFLSIFFITATVIISYISADNIRNSFARKYTNVYSKAIKNRISALINKSVTASLQMSELPVVREWMKTYNPALKQRVFNTLKALNKYLDKNIDIFITVHKNLHYYFNYRYIETLYENKAKDKWYFMTIKQREKFNLNIDMSTLKMIKLFVNVPVKENGKILGAIGTGENIGLFLSRVLKEIESGTYLILINKKGIIKAHINEKYVKKNKNLFSLISNNKSKNRLINSLNLAEKKPNQALNLDIKLKGINYFASLRYMGNINWYLLYLVKPNHFVKISSFYPLILAAIISFIIFFVVLFFLTNQVIIKPILNLTDFTQKIADKNFDEKIKIHSDDEIGKLYNTFNDMRVTIKNYTENLENLVKERTYELDKKNKLLTDSINYSKTIQSQLFPKEQDLKKCFTEYGIIYKPRDIVGGDFYWLKQLDETKFVFAVADCTGHGVPGALLTMISASILNLTVNKNNFAAPSKILPKLDEIIRNTLNQDKDYALSNDGLEIALVSIDLSKNKLIYSGANIPLFYCRDNKVDMIMGDRHRLGYKRRKNLKMSFTDHSIDIQDAPVFYISTDGFFDQNGENEIETFGKKRFEKLLKSFYTLNLDEQVDKILKTYNEFKTNRKQRDDITVIGFKI